MSLTDEEFREEYKPLHVPSNYDSADTLQNKMIFALARLGTGTADEVLAELEELEPGINNEQNKVFVGATLSTLFEHGRLSGSEIDGQMNYNLVKITQANAGEVIPPPKEQE